jgi:hypothetical protein
MAGCTPRAPSLPVPAADPSAGGAEAAQWTVELHSGERAAAEDVASDARLRFDEPVTVVPIGGAHHVRVGAFRTEVDAEAFAKIARERGYRSARPVSLEAGSAGGP